MSDDIGDYYDRIRERGRIAWQRYCEACERLPPGDPELSRLYDAAVDAGDCGD